MNINISNISRAQFDGIFTNYFVIHTNQLIRVHNFKFKNYFMIFQFFIEMYFYCFIIN